MPAVVQAQYSGDYRIHLRCNDGWAATVDIAQWLDGEEARAGRPA